MSDKKRMLREVNSAKKDFNRLVIYVVVMSAMVVAFAFFMSIGSKIMYFIAITAVVSALSIVHAYKSTKSYIKNVMDDLDDDDDD